MPRILLLSAVLLPSLIGCAPRPEASQMSSVEDTLPAETPKKRQGDTPRLVVIDPVEPLPKSTAPRAIPAVTAKEKPEELFLSFTTKQGQTVKLPATGDPWADRLVAHTAGNPGPKKRAANPKDALGKPNVVRQGGPAGVGSLALGHGGELVLEFTDNVLVDGKGDDLVIFEIGPAIESTFIDISTDGKDWVKLGSIKGAKSTIDIGPHVKPGQQFRFVRLTDAKEGKSNKGIVPGADIDAVGTINMIPVKSVKSAP